MKFIKFVKGLGCAVFVEACAFMGLSLQVNLETVLAATPLALFILLGYIFG